MENSKKKILNKLKEGEDKDVMQTRFNDRLQDAENIVKTTIPNMEPEDVKDIAARLATESVETEGFNPVVQYHSDRTDETPFMINGTKWQYVNAIYPNGKKDIAVYRYGHDLAYDYKWFMDNVVGNLKNANEGNMDEGEHGSVGRGIEAGMNPEVEADKYEEYRALMQQLAAEEGGEQPVGPVSEGGPTTDIEGVTDSLVNMFINGSSDEKLYIIAKKTLDGHGADSQTKRDFYMTLANKLKNASINNPSLSDKLNRASQTYNSISRTGIREDDTITPEQTNDPVKLKNDVAKLMAKLDISSIAPYLAKIDNPTEQAEVIAQFAEKIGVPKAKLSSVVAQLRTVAESVKMTKNKLIETVTGRKVIKTIKVKDIK